MVSFVDLLGIFNIRARFLAVLISPLIDHLVHLNLTTRPVRLFVHLKRFERWTTPF
jgi:hypothetical protein